MLSRRSGIAHEEDAEIKAAFDWTIQTMSLLCQLDGVLSNLVDAWKSFSSPDGDIGYFRDTDVARILPNSRRSLSTIKSIFRHLEGTQKKINLLNKSCSEFKGSVS
jgi:hypothetical protein